MNACVLTCTIRVLYTTFSQSFTHLFNCEIVCHLFNNASLSGSHFYILAMAVKHRANLQQMNYKTWVKFLFKADSFHIGQVLILKLHSAGKRTIYVPMLHRVRLQRCSCRQARAACHAALGQASLAACKHLTHADSALVCRSQLLSSSTVADLASYSFFVDPQALKPCLKLKSELRVNILTPFARSVRDMQGNRLLHR